MTMKKMPAHGFALAAASAALLLLSSATVHAQSADSPPRTLPFCCGAFSV